MSDDRRVDIVSEDQESVEGIEMTKNEENEDKSGGTLFIIEGGWGYNVQPYSQFPEEEEILLEPEREFEVTSVTDSGDLLLITLNMKNTKAILSKVFGKGHKWIVRLFIDNEHN